MSFPIPVNMTVSERNVPVTMSVAENSASYDMDVETEIVAGTTAEYEGPYSVTPTEQAQTLETADLKMAQDVSIGAIASDYVGSSIPHRIASDLTASGPTVTAPAGYYEEAASKTIPNATPMPGLHAVVSPSTVTVNANGLVNASVGSTTQAIAPVGTAGYAPSNFTAMFAIYGGSKTLQLDTRAGATITPTESVQTAVQAKRYTTGEVKVGAIPSDYIGSQVPQKSSSDLTASGATVTAPAGYYASDASKAISNASLSNQTISVTPDISVDANGLVTASKTYSTIKTPVSSAGYAKTTDAIQITANVSNTYQIPTIGSTTYTPSNVAQEIAAGKYLTGVQTISAIAPPYYDMSGANAWMGADAELVTTVNLADVKLSATDFATWTPSTTATDILATRTAGTFTASDMPDYDYYVLWETKIPIVYLSGSTNKAKGLYLSAFHVQALVRRASSYDNLQAGNLNSNVNLSAFTGGNFYRYYNATQDNLTYTNNTSYGFYGTVTANTFSSSTATSPTVTLKTPKVTARCSTTYLSTGNASLIDQTNTIISQKCTVYKVKAPSFMRGIWNNVMRMVQEIDPA